jgi:hypothetical protein
MITARERRRDYGILKKNWRTRSIFMVRSKRINVPSAMIPMVRPIPVS